MKAKISRFLVVTLGVSFLGSFAIAPRTTYGQSDDTQARIQAEKEETRKRIQDQKAYLDGYNEGFERAREEERQRLDDEAFNSQQGGCCPSGGGQQQRRR